MSIVFTDHEVKSGLKNRRKLRNFIRSQVEKYGYNIETISVVFCGDEYLLEINRQFLNHDTYTDIITFDMRESDADRMIDTEIYISIDRVNSNAKELGISKNEELHRVIFHGLLHLMGYADKTEEQKKNMRAEENKWLKNYKKYINEG